MEAPIIVSFRWTYEEMVLLNRLHLKNLMKRRDLGLKPRAWGIPAIIFGIILCATASRARDGVANTIFGVFIIITGAALAFGFPILMKKSVKRVYGQKPDKDLPVIYKASDEGLSYRSDVSSSEMLWKGFLKALRAREGLMLYTSDHGMHWLPVHGFQNPADVDKLADLIKAKIRDYRDVR